MAPLVASVMDQWNATVMTYGPGIVGALIVLLIGWIVGRLLGRAVRIILDKISEQHFIEEVADQTSFAGSVKKAGSRLPPPVRGRCDRSPSAGWGSGSLEDAKRAPARELQPGTVVLAIGRCAASAVPSHQGILSLPTRSRRRPTTSLP